MSMYRFMYFVLLTACSTHSMLKICLTGNSLLKCVTVRYTLLQFTKVCYSLLALTELLKPSQVALDECEYPTK